MTIAVAILLTVATFAAAAYPFFRQRDGIPEPPQNDKSLKELHFRRDHTYALLKELENDYQSGTLSKNDFKKLEAQYKTKAVTILQQIDNFQEEKSSNEDLQDDIEQQITRLRRKKGFPAGGDQVETEKRLNALNQSKSRFCPQCGAKSSPDDRFCSDCGSRLATKRNT